MGGVTQNTQNTFPALTGYSGRHEMLYVVMKCMLLEAYTTVKNISRDKNLLPISELQSFLHKPLHCTA